MRQEKEVRLFNDSLKIAEGLTDVEVNELGEGASNRSTSLKSLEEYERARWREHTISNMVHGIAAYANGTHPKPGNVPEVWKKIDDPCVKAEVYDLLELPTLQKFLANKGLVHSEAVPRITNEVKRFVKEAPAPEKEQLVKGIWQSLNQKMKSRVSRELEKDLETTARVLTNPNFKLSQKQREEAEKKLMDRLYLETLAKFSGGNPDPGAKEAIMVIQGHPLGILLWKKINENKKIMNLLEGKKINK
ncbi:hypothetical protein COX85_02190 [Candidatus Micrarchaeota archaeon CG_4_10_14_0_2_um_filter_55_9]|nr:MAG: hypothetical protein AUJ15_01170 [Candidatus Micrarchaeota archaeon CG1_02_55_41]PIO03059.1 MAG: hypothetical protein COT57_01135 [Candidatus Micrarchaeota archaeon CG09_land_8_20_14_0_10_55_25]PIZ91753.1 MAG: hypothetical protein COX85_02190 [Candidatus Micrarchaeota archaeon CG_4_10_14_0_2_um_filter_55_9]